MQEPDKMINRLLKQQAEMMARRNERFAIILDELEVLSTTVELQFTTILDRIRRYQQKEQ
ncbi:MAG: hypothetical protein AAFQ02_05200 [Bacteroidota bacterium]